MEKAARGKRVRIVVVAVLVFIAVLLPLVFSVPQHNPGHSWSQLDCDTNLCISGGNVGIGTTNPSTKLDVEVTSGFNLELNNTNSANAAAMQFVNNANQNWQVGSIGSAISGRANTFEIYDITAGAARLTIQNSTGNVGIGTTVPGANLEVFSTTQNIARIRLSGQEFYQAGNTGTGVSLLLGVDRTNNKQLWFADSDQLGTPSSSALRINLGGTPAISALTMDGITSKDFILGVGGNQLYLSAGGNVGIGTASPQGPLHVFKDGAAADTIGGSIILNRYLVGGSWRGGAIFSEYVGAASQDLLVFAVSQDTTPLDIAKAKMVIGVNGNVGIGTTNPGAFLQVSTNVAKSTTANTDAARFSSNDTTNPLQLVVQINGNSVAANSYTTIQSVEQNVATRNLALNPGGGNVGIGTASPGSKLEVNGNIGFTGVTATAARVTNGSYTGNSVVNRAIAHGLGVAPKFVYITQTAGGTQNPLDFFMLGSLGRITDHYGTGAGVQTVTIADTTNFYVGNAANQEAAANLNAATYYWVAYG